MEFQDKVILVTGATSGIGEASARRFAASGGRVGILGRDGKATADVTASIQSQGGSAFGLVADVADAGMVERAVKELLDNWGRLDVVVANAGINGMWSPIEELTPDEWDRTLSTNLKGTFLTIKYAVPYLKRGDDAPRTAITVVSSINGTRVFSTAGASAYATSKAGQLALTKMAALELAKHRIRVNVICPGAITTSIDESTERRDIDAAREPAEYPEGDIPLTDGAPGSSEQVADLIHFLSSDVAAHITGTEMWIDGGQSLLRG